MPIPALNEHGLLPPGTHDCTLAEIEARFGQFQRSDRRCVLFSRLASFIREVGKVEFAIAVVIDGSFVTAKDEPNDIDLVLILSESHDFAAELRPFEYNIVSKKRILREYGFDIVIDGAGTVAMRKHLDFFSRVRERADILKGLLRVMI
ncbi:MAG TPA: hypothetical protein VFV87_10935 [Pirellulaceae bacterium]|nr:hypothetical protein [Pirellulaceae bacterium]